MTFESEQAHQSPERKVIIASTWTLPIIEVKP
jgi:hypothetical protein